MESNRFSHDPRDYDPARLVFQHLAPGQSTDRLTADLLHTAIDHLKVGILVSDPCLPDNPIVFASRGFTAITGYTAQEVLGRNGRFLQGPDTDLAVVEQLKRALIEKRRFQGEIINYRKDGTPFWNELIICPAYNEKGRLTNYVSLLSDISERKTATASMEDAEAKYRAIFENAAEGIYQSTPDGVYLEVNPALARMYGFSSARELMANVRDIQSQIYVDGTVRERFQREVEAKGEVRGLEYQVRRVDGAIIWISEDARAVRDNTGAIRYYEGIIQDITSRKEAEAAHAKLEEQLRQSQKLEAIGTLAGGIAHDFNNILCAIVGFSELALDDSKLQGRTRKNLEQVLSASHRARDLVKQILTFSRRDDPERKALHLTHIIKEALKLLSASLPSNIEIRQHLNVADDIVIADPTQIHQVLMNLCTNAAHAMREKGGLLEVTLDETVLASTPSLPTATTTATTAITTTMGSNSHLCLTVRDTGHGMAPHTMERIFEPFFTTKSLGEGTGLGLSVVHGIINAHGGTIQVESKLNHGTTFQIILPRAGEISTLPDQSEASPLQGGRERLLIVDDELSILSILQQRLRKLGYRIITRADSNEALQTLRQEPNNFDLIITDQSMPRLTGTQLRKEMLQLRPDLPVIVMTGFGTASLKELDYAASPTAVIAKPIDFKSLSSTLRRLLDKAQAKS